MLLANNEINQRIVPYKGGRAFCPFCNETVIAVCGEINIHHWRHDINTNCDPWKESETEWHRTWKEKFPIEWREFIITKHEEKHIADIRTDSGLIVEFQNSSISSTTIKVRETFYENMIWLINAEIFKDNFSIRSLVKSKLRENEHRFNSYLSYNTMSEDSLKNYDDKIRELNQDIKSTISEINWQQKKFEDLNDYLADIKKSVDEILSTEYFYGDLSDFKSELIAQLKKYKTDFDELDKSKTDLTKLIDTINNLPNSKVANYENLKSVSFNQVSAKSFQKCKLVHTETINSFFPKVIPILSESNFRWYSNQPDKFSLMIDLNDDLKKLNLKLETIEEKGRQLIKLKEELSLNLQTELAAWLNDQIEQKKLLIENLGNKRDDLTIELDELLTEKEEALNQLKEDNLQLEKELEDERKSKEIDIKRSNKGFYTYNWKYRRKTWDYADCPIFLDFGTHIFKIETENKLRKIEINEFIKMIKNWR